MHEERMSRALPLHQWPAEQRAQIAGVITDIDDTLTEGGHLMAQARSALQELADAGVPVIAVTGRPVGWSLRCLGGPGAQEQAPWPLLGVVAENGAVALWRGPDGQVLRRYRAGSATRQAHWQRLQAALAAVEQAVPQARRAQDSGGRETDIAIDHSEFHHLSAAQIEQVVELLRGHGLRVSVSSIHINAWLGDHDKWVGACWAVEHWLDQQLSEQLAHWVYIGDSSNDEVMFEHMQHSAGVANIARFLDRLEHVPRYLCAQSRGAGFAELASAVLQARATGPQ
jgi:HAD superfamily hydrolase (TIGR01484 family)